MNAGKSNKENTKNGLSKKQHDFFNQRYRANIRIQRFFQNGILCGKK
jgi:hypothetical protein